jgi:hypothetical protein
VTLPVQPSLQDGKRYSTLIGPGDESPGYYRLSLRDECTRFAARDRQTTLRIEIVGNSSWSSDEHFSNLTSPATFALFVAVVLVGHQNLSFPISRSSAASSSQRQTDVPATDILPLDGAYVQVEKSATLAVRDRTSRGNRRKNCSAETLRETPSP